MSDKIVEDYEMSDDESFEEDYELRQEFLKYCLTDPTFHVWLNTRSIYNMRRLENPSASRLRMFINTLSKYLHRLELLKSDVMVWSNSFVKIIYSKLDPLTKSKWDETFRGVDFKNIDVSTMMSFLHRTCEEYEKLNLEPEEEEDTEG